MKMELGYACINLNLKDCTPNRRTTVGHLKKLSLEGQEIKLNTLLKENLENTLRILKFNKAHNIKFYRFSSNVVPLATHEVSNGWDYLDKFKEKFLEIGNYAKENDIRVSMHASQYTILNSNRKDVVKRSIEELEYHSNFLLAMGLDTTTKVVLHIGGVYGNKEKAISRFKKNFKALPEDMKSRLIIENDDKSYTATEVLEIAEDLGIPIVFDIHHFNCNHTEDEKLEELLPRVFATWEGHGKPKFHFSTPRSEDDYASHADNIDPKDFKDFIDILKSTSNTDFDIMLECKNKDKALLKLREDFESIYNLKI
ncbi:UV damage endonuclease UvsE [Orenia metallireducens]|uniref:UV damage endonuclease UvsE n=2 Tax=Orenia metallireducens TaxID=1413210 RepID=A0A1C0A6U6_9FIRM|nr:UV damage endonuclease UvsE [Orenia metallireducens]